MGGMGVFAMARGMTKTTLFTGQESRLPRPLSSREGGILPLLTFEL